jgi:hypothetical protein
MMKIIIKKFLNQLSILLNCLIPKTRKGDYIYSVFHFFRVHGRVPKNKHLLSDEAMSPLRGYISDKVWVKNYIKEKVGMNKVIPTLAVLNSIDEFEKYILPNRCCIKPSHASGEVILRENGEKIDLSLIKSWLKLNYYKSWREVNYRYLPRRIIVEPLIFDSVNVEDYKLFCYKGNVKFIQVDLDRQSDHSRAFYNTNWDRLEFSMVYKVPAVKIQRPKNLNEMIVVAEKLCQEFEFIRVDLYTDGQQIFVGELTNWPESSLGKFGTYNEELAASEMIFDN